MAGVHPPTVLKAGSMKSGYQQGHVPSEALGKILPFLFLVSAGGCSQETCIWVKKQQLEPRFIKQLFPDPRLHRLCFEYPGSAGAGPRLFTRDLLQSIDLSIWFCLPL